MRKSTFFIIRFKLHKKIPVPFTKGAGGRAILKVDFIPPFLRC